MTGVEVSAHISVVWGGPTQDDPGTQVTGLVVGWVDNEARADQQDAVVMLDSPLTAEGATHNRTEERAIGTGAYLTLATRYVGQEWDNDEGVVHVNLHPVDPRENGSHGLWLASHGVYRVTASSRV